IQRQEEEDDELVMPRLSENIQRQPMEEEEEMLQPRQSEQIQRQEEEEEMQPRLSDEVQRQEEEEYAMTSQSDQSHLNSGPLSESVENQVQRARQGGDALDTNTRSKMEGGFGYDFNNVQIHNDSTADNVSKQLNAEAFTLNNDIFFRSGRYNPTSTQGQDLLAHELTHVVQQGAATDLEPVAEQQ
ncbi:MAG: DUF4157 domain-containing protein, partial [Anaerolineae bacterium]|nr:DUF4157 domain-containing protein [Anaerolineae bacterium]